jgi:hypothetical protein
MTNIIVQKKNKIVRLTKTVVLQINVNINKYK